MVEHRDEIVFVQLWGRLVLRLDDKAREVQTPHRKLHKGVQLLLGDLGVGKTLQVGNECLRQLPQV